MHLYVYILRRLLLMLFVLFALSLLIFYLTRGLLPPTSALAPYITPRMDDSAKLSVARAVGVATSSCPSFQAFTSLQSGCIVPVWGQYGAWAHNVLTGNWGYSLLPSVAPLTPTWDVFWSRFPYTAELAIAAAILTIALGIPLGIVSATHNNKWPDHLSRVVSLGGYSVPQFWFGAVLQIVFVLYIRLNGLGLLSTSSAVATACGICFANPGTITTFTGAPVFDAVLSLNAPYLWDSLVALVLPALTLAITSIGAITRIVRSSMMEALRQDYITLARSKGLSDRVVVYRHALRNAILPAVTISGLLVSYLMGGVVVVEIVFSWPGVGNASLAAANVLDVNFLELYVLVTAVIIVVTNLIVDIAYGVLDPRIRY
ncbi:MAG: ABC transporter permease [Nitrososphaerota archaeon]|nr:ABC transporter permease [Nitrososphaerota archaeon]MDG7024150.1 ABC transporter permease [Nitrososphaerota archaeon]